MGIIVATGLSLEHAFDHIPRVDLSSYSLVDLKTPLPHDLRHNIENAMLESLFTYGVAVITTSKSDTAMADHVHKAAADFFAMDIAQKILASNTQNEDGCRK